jgi:hypothetical protein
MVKGYFPSCPLYALIAARIMNTTYAMLNPPAKIRTVTTPIAENAA